MKVTELSYPHDLDKFDLPEAVCAIGFFDGIHKGHQKVIQTAVDLAKVKNMESAVITFHPHPSVVLRKDVQKVQYLTTMKDKVELVEQLHVDRLYIIEFNRELSSLSPQEFIDHFVIGLNIRHLVAGFDYSFGFKGQGNMKNISEFTRGSVEATMVEQVSTGEEKISSTRIRNLLREGDVEEANSLLGRPLLYRGVVIKGAQRGRELGYPTANLMRNTEVLLPKPGIYAVKAIVGGTEHLGMASIGTNPTFTADRKDLSIEVNLLDASLDLYGQELIVEWHRYIREEEKFSDAAELIAQIEKDEREIRDFFSRQSK